MRGWPPFLHLMVLAAVLPLAGLRLDAALTSEPPAQSAEAVAEAAAGAVADHALMPVKAAPVDLVELAARPLFQPGRQGGAVAQAAVPTAEAPDPAARVRMVGYVNDGTKPRAILSLGEEQPEEIVRVGDAFGGYEVRSIGKTSVVLMSDGEEITINMFDQ